MSVYAFLLIGLVLLFAGGEALVRGAVGAARSLGVSPLLIGITLVGFGTSTPELVASVQAALAGSPGIAIGNVVGSNTANILLILAVAGLIGRINIAPGPFKRDGTVLLGATALAGLAFASGLVTRLIGLLFIALLLAYVTYSYLSERAASERNYRVSEVEELSPVRKPLWRFLLLTVIGLAGVIFGARLLVGAAIDLARMFEIPETVIGITVVAVGTSLPELAACASAALRKQGDVAFGNIVGSNIFNILFILGTTAVIRPIAVPSEILRLDYWIMAGASILLVVVSYTGWKIIRREAAFLLLLYIGYMTLLFSPSARSLVGLS